MNKGYFKLGERGYINRYTLFEQLISPFIYMLVRVFLLLYGRWDHLDF